MGRQPESGWSVELHIATQVSKYWLICHKGIRNNVIVTSGLQEMFEKLPIEKQTDIQQKIKNLTTSRRQIVVRQDLSKSLKYKRELLKHHKTNG